jgi:hypothetical protein
MARCFLWSLALVGLTTRPPESPLEAVAGFLAAMKAKDPAGMTARVDSAARFTLLRPGSNGTELAIMSGPDFVALTTKADGPTYDEVTRNPVVLEDGDLATVWAEYQVSIDGRLSHCGHDAVHLARLAGRWKIIHLSDTFHREGCGERWP